MPVGAVCVYGDPSPQGGTKTVPNRLKAGQTIHRKITEGGVNLKSWRQECASAAAEQAELHGKYDGPVRVEFQFRFVMPKSRPAWARRAGVALKSTTPDLDKLERAVGDSLVSGGLLHDDALIVQKRSTKIEVVDGWTGVALRVTPLDPQAFTLGSEW